MTSRSPVEFDTGVREMFRRAWAFASGGANAHAHNSAMMAPAARSKSIDPPQQAKLDLWSIGPNLPDGNWRSALAGQSEFDAAAGVIVRHRRDGGALLLAGIGRTTATHAVGARHRRIPHDDVVARTRCRG